jgi:hypothetical protein
MSGVISNTIVTDGLILYYDGANPKCYISGDTTSNDLSITQSNGTLENGVTYNVDNNGSWVFDGIDDYIDFSDNPSFDIDGTNTVSFNSWIKKEGGIYFPVFAKLYYPNSTIQDGYRCYIPSSTNQVVVNLYGSGGSNITVYSINPISNNQWLYLSITYDGSETAVGVKIYVNGILVSMGIFVDTFVGTMINTVPLTLGGQPTLTNPLYANGKISVTKIYNRELTQEEVLQNYNAMKSRFNL